MHKRATCYVSTNRPIRPGEYASSEQKTSCHKLDALVKGLLAKGFKPDFVAFGVKLVDSPEYTRIQFNREGLVEEVHFGSDTEHRGPMYRVEFWEDQTGWFPDSGTR